MGFAWAADYGREASASADVRGAATRSSGAGGYRGGREHDQASVRRARDGLHRAGRHAQARPQHPVFASLAARRRLKRGAHEVAGP